MAEKSRTINVKFLNALKLKYESQTEQAIATISLYLSNPLAVADHSNFLEEIDKWLSVLVDSSDKLDALTTHFSNQSDSLDYTVTIAGDKDISSIEFED